MLVEKKTCRLKKKMSVGEFPLPKTDMSGMSGIPCNARPKNSRGGKKRPRAYRGEKKGNKVRHLEKKAGRKNKMLVGKKICRLKKKCRLENFPCQKLKCPDIPWNARPKNGRGGKKRPRAYRGEKKIKKFVIWRKKNCWLENFPCHFRKCLDIPWNARPKNGRGGKKRP